MRELSEMVYGRHVAQHLLLNTHGIKQWCKNTLGNKTSYFRLKALNRENTEMRSRRPMLTFSKWNPFVVVRARKQPLSDMVSQRLRLSSNKLVFLSSSGLLPSCQCLQKQQGALNLAPELQKRPNGPGDQLARRPAVRRR